MATTKKVSKKKAASKKKASTKKAPAKKAASKKKAPAKAAPAPEAPADAVGSPSTDTADVTTPDPAPAPAASKKKAPAKKAASKKKASTKKAAKDENKKVEKKMSGPTVIGTSKLYQLNPKNIVVVEGFNPRIDMGDMQSLMASIKHNGMKQPIVVRKVGQHYELVDGHRRLMAALKLALNKVPAILETSKMTKQELLNRALIANDGKPLAPVEEADAFRRLMNDGWTPRQISVATGRSLRLVKDRLTLISAHPDVSEAVKKGKLSIGLGLAIAKKSKASKKTQAKKVKEATRGETAKKRVASQLGKATLRAKFDKRKVNLQNRINKLVPMVNKKRAKKEQVPAGLADQLTFFNKHKDKVVRAAFVAGGLYAITDVLGGVKPAKAPKRKRTAQGKQTRQVRPK